MTEAFSEQPAGGRTPVGEGGGAELADTGGSGVALPTCHEFRPPQNQGGLKSHL